MKIKRRTLAGIGFVILCALLYLSIWQDGLLLWISPPPLGEHSVIVSIQPVPTARPTTVLVRYGLPWWAWAVIGAVTLAYSRAVGWCFWLPGEEFPPRAFLESDSEKEFNFTV
ncbi:MAG: hypothetical protein ACPLPW_05430 [bacterium]